ncbi:MAG: hypothetical protein GX568_01405 [Candidatus Gastranaerophilales bacterium]|jgi:antitoxin component of MazEF toxin-antitoxin module|nr:hypothetical protein [Candidatus Gastranaerophilales bacterium]
MILRELKKLGNSKCLPLDKTLQEVLGLDPENPVVNITIKNNRLIIEKAREYEEPNRFLLDDKQWEQFNKALETRPESLSNIKKLLNEPGVFDE